MPSRAIVYGGTDQWILTGLGVSATHAPTLKSRSSLSNGVAARRKPLGGNLIASSGMKCPLLRRRLHHEIFDFSADTVAGGEARIEQLTDHCTMSRSLNGPATWTCSPVDVSIGYYARISLASTRRSGEARGQIC